MTPNYTPHTLTPTEIANAREQHMEEMSTVASRAENHNARRGEQTTICDDCGNANLAHTRAVWTDDGASYCPTCRNLNAREQHKPASRADLPHYAGLREGDMVHDTRGLPVVLIIAGAVFTLMVLGAWAIWADPVGRTAATVLQAEGEGQ